jgi:hypothetical protein
MVNIRFHIVSLTAVFLSLAIGIVMGSSLLDRATVGSLTKTQSSLEKKITQRGQENDALRKLADADDDAQERFAAGPMHSILNGTVTDQVLVVAARGVPAAGVEAVQADLRAIGAPQAGLVWWEPRADLSDDNVRRAAAEALGADSSADKGEVLNRAISTLARALAQVGVPAGGGGDTTGTDGAVPTTTAVPPSTAPTTTAAPGSTDGADLPPGGPAAGTLLEDLTRTGMITWSVQGTGAPREVITDRPLRVVVISGEGADDHQDDALRRLATATAAHMPGRVVVCELLDQRSSVSWAQRSLTQPPLRGEFVAPLRRVEATGKQLATVDSLDLPFGRFALLRLLALPAAEATGSYGVTDGAAGPFPSR